MEILETEKDAVKIKNLHYMIYARISYLICCVRIPYNEFTILRSTDQTPKLQIINDDRSILISRIVNIFVVLWGENSLFLD